MTGGNILVNSQRQTVCVCLINSVLQEKKKQKSFQAHLYKCNYSHFVITNSTYLPACKTPDMVKSPKSVMTTFPLS